MARAAFKQVDEYETGWLAEVDLPDALGAAGCEEVTAADAAACVARLQTEHGQEEDGFLSIDEFERVHGWLHTVAQPEAEPEPAPEPEPEPEREPEPSAEEDEDAFNTQEYWEKFNADAGCYEWYGGDGLQESIVQAVVHHAKLLRPDDPTAARILDVGTGTSPILFVLTEREQFTAVEGTDFSARACDFMSEEVEKRGLAGCLRYRQADGRRLDEVYAAGTTDLILDKGCLDCFVSGRGHADIALYLAQLRQLLAAPAGRILLVPVNGAHIPTLLATGAIVRETHMTQRPGGADAAPRFPACHPLTPAQISALEDEAWKQHCGVAADGDGDAGGTAWEQQLFIEKVIAMEEKHLFVCALQPLPNEEQPTLECGACGKSYSSEGYPDSCVRCKSKLVRWCLS